MKNTSICRLLALTAGIMMLVVLSGCNKLSDPDRKGSRIMVDVRSGMYYTKADCGPQLVDVIKSESGDMVLEEYVSDYPEYSSPASTKGAAITTHGYNPITGKTFYIEGWLSDPSAFPDAETDDKNDYHFIKKNSVSYSDGSWSISDENFWRNGIPTTFWSYVPPTNGTLEIKWPGSSAYGGTPYTTYASPDKPDDNAQKSLSFTYTLPDPGGDDNDAYNLQDFLFAYNKETRSLNSDGGIAGGESEYFKINFYHPLAAVKFDIGSLNGSTAAEDWDYVEVTKIELIDVAKSGNFTATGSTESLTFACSTSSKDTYVQSNNVTREVIEDGMFTGNDSEYVFFMIPQNLTGVKVRVTFQKRPKSGEPIQTVTRTADLTGSWASGKYYTYQISAWINVAGEDIDIPTSFTDQNGKTFTLPLYFDSKNKIISETLSNVFISNVKTIHAEWDESGSNANASAQFYFYLIDSENKISSNAHSVKFSSEAAGTSYPGGTFNDTVSETGKTYTLTYPGGILVSKTFSRHMSFDFNLPEGFKPPIRLRFVFNEAPTGQTYWEIDNVSMSVIDIY